MNRIAFYRKMFCSLLVFQAGLFTTLSAESFRVNAVHTLPVSLSAEQTTIKVGINDSVILVLPDDRTYLQGIELSIKVPQVVASWKDSVAWSIYDGVSPQPSTDCIDYTGTRTVVGTFNSLSLNLQIPLSKKNTIKKSPYEVYVKDLPAIIGNTVFFRLQLAMKGVPEEIFDAEFEMTAKPILVDKGRLVVSVAAPADTTLQPYTAFIDGTATILDKNGIVLDCGVHNISLVSDFYRNELRTVTIEQAKTSSVQITFRDITPMLLITAPLDAVIYVDEEKISNTKNPFPVSQGDHTVRFVIGDYEVVKTVKTVKGRSYTVSVSIDATISESQ